MINFFDNFLNRITMYRLMLYYLTFLVALAALFGFLGILHYDPISIIFSTLVLVFVSLITNEIFSRVFGAQPNIESVYITALILALIINPAVFTDTAKITFLIWAAVLATASKYILAINRKHIFNPAAFAVALTAFTINESASWWAGGNLPMMPFVVLGGLLVVRKIRRFDLVSSFFAAGLATVILTGDLNNPFSTLEKALLHAPFFFFAFIMLTEPLTTPPTRLLRIVYGALTGFLFAPAIHIANIYSTPELSLLAGNIFSYFVSPKKKYILKLLGKEKVGNGIYDFIFDAGEKIKFRAGQYMEWTIGQKKPDTRGNRRYFTIASSPTENEIRLGVKFYDSPSTFKNEMMLLVTGGEIIAGHLAGDFVLPSGKNEKLAFLAGGIGVTPFRSMAKYLSDTSERRDIVHLYSSKTAPEVAYKDVFDEAEKKIGMKTVYILGAAGSIPENMNSRIGMIDKTMIEKEIPDYKDRTFYISGPHSMVAAMEKALREIGVKGSRIKVDFFPGFV